jgi:hypothetical protein
MKKAITILIAAVVLLSGCIQQQVQKCKIGIDGLKQDWAACGIDNVIDFGRQSNTTDTLQLRNLSIARDRDGNLFALVEVYGNLSNVTRDDGLAVKLRYGDVCSFFISYQPFEEQEFIGGYYSGEELIRTNVTGAVSGSVFESKVDGIYPLLANETGCGKGVAFTGFAAAGAITNYPMRNWSINQSPEI